MNIIIKKENDFISLQQRSGNKDAFALTIQNLKHADIVHRFGDYSTQIKVPNTSFNNYALGGLNGLNARTSEKIEGRIEEQSLKIASGYYKVLSYNSKDIILRFFGESNNVFATLNDVKLRELDMSRYNFEYTVFVVNGKISSLDGIKTYFTGMSQNKGVEDNTFNLLSYNVGTFVKTILEQVETQFNVKFGGKLISETSYPYLMTSGVSDLSQYLIKPFVSETTRKTIRTDYFSGAEEFAPLFPPLINGAYDGKIFIAEAALDSIYFEQKLVTTFIEVGQFEYVLSRRVNGVTFADVIGDMVPAHEDGGALLLKEWLPIPIPNTSMIKDDYIHLKYRIKSGNINSYGYVLFNDYLFQDGHTGHSSTKIEFQNSHSLVDVAESLPDISVGDLLKELMVLYNLTIEHDRNTGIYNFIDYERTSKSVISPVNIEGMVDVSKEINFDTNKMTEKYGQLSTINFKESGENDSYLRSADLLSFNETKFGGGSLVLDDNSLVSQTVIHESVFQTGVMAWQSPTDLNDSRVAKWIFHQENRYSSTFDDVGVEEFEFLSPEPRLLLDGGTIDVREINRGGHVSIRLSTAEDPNPVSGASNVGVAYCTKTFIEGTDVDSDALNGLQEQIAFDNWFGQLQPRSLYFNRFYKNTEKTLNKGITLSLHLRLSALFVKNLDLEVPYLYKGKKYQLETVDQFQGSQGSTKCIFVEI